MNTAKQQQEQSVDLGEAALTMAIAVLVERISSLPREDREDLFKLSKVLFAAESPEESRSAQRAFREILDQSKGKTVAFCSEDEASGMKGWIAFISGRIREARESAGLTQEALEAVTGLPQSHISRLENGVHSPSSTTLQKIANATGKPMTFFDPSDGDECE